MNVRIAVLATICTAGATLQAQSLAEVARKTAEERANKPEGRVYTNKDLKDVPSAVAVGTNPDREPAPKAAEKKPVSVPAGAAGLKDEESWRARMERLRAQLTQDERDLKPLLARLADLRKTYNTIIDFALQSGRGTSPITNPVGIDLERAESDVKSQQARIQDDKAAIADLEEEARRAGVPPGWLRIVTASGERDAYRPHIRRRNGAGDIAPRELTAAGHSSVFRFRSRTLAIGRPWFSWALLQGHPGSPC